MDSPGGSSNKKIHTLARSVHFGFLHTASYFQDLHVSMLNPQIKSWGGFGSASVGSRGKHVSSSFVHEDPGRPDRVLQNLRRSCHLVYPPTGSPSRCAAVSLTESRKSRQFSTTE